MFNQKTKSSDANSERAFLKAPFLGEARAVNVEAQGAKGRTTLTAWASRYNGGARHAADSVLLGLYFVIELHLNQTAANGEVYPDTYDWQVQLV